MDGPRVSMGITSPVFERFVIGATRLITENDNPRLQNTETLHNAVRWQVSLH